jgi:hypothetical protein
MSFERIMGLEADDEVYQQYREHMIAFLRLSFYLFD